MLLLSPKIIPGIRLKVAIANVRNSLSGPPRSVQLLLQNKLKYFLGLGQTFVLEEDAKIDQDLVEV